MDAVYVTRKGSKVCIYKNGILRFLPAELDEIANRLIFGDVLERLGGGASPL